MCWLTRLRCAVWWLEGEAMNDSSDLPKLPPLPVLRSQSWICARCRRLFLRMEDCVAHNAACRGDWLRQPVVDKVGAERAEPMVGGIG